jgi:(R,R)-butanediol dehydrogenase/meso-butanediol dehydrogenase/diacetyl reductase
MKAAVFDGHCGVRIVDCPIPEIGMNEALVKVKYVGICGSDITIYMGKNNRAKIPVIPGHEIVGEIVAIKDDDSNGFTIGERVGVVPTLTCNSCELCNTGRRHLCKSIHFIGIQTDGGFAEYVKVPVANLIQLPEGMTFEKAVLVEPVAVASHAIRLARVEAGDFAVVIGAGPIGLFVAMLARYSGCRVLMSEISESRAKFAENLGFSIIHGSGKALISQVKELTKDRGADLIFECVGHPSTIDQMIDIGRSEAQFVIVGAFKEPAPLDLFRMSRNEQRLVASWTYTNDDFRRAIQFLNEPSIPLERVISHFIPLDQTHEAMEMVRKAEKSMKVILKVS